MTFFGEDVVRYRCELPASTHENLGRPTLFPTDGSRFRTLDFTLRHRTPGRTFIAELKCELEYEGHRRNREVTRLALVVFNGTVMRDQPAHANLEGATFLEDVRTAPAYRLWTIGDRHPAMMRAEEGGTEVEAELYEVPDDVWPRIRDTEPPGLYRGPVELSDGRHVEGMLGEQSLIDGPDALEITEFGGWRAYLGSKR